MKSKLIKIILTKFVSFIKYWPLFLAFSLFVLLLAKNPFSERTLIPNFEPFPDSFYYIVTPRCWLGGQGWQLCRRGMVGVESGVAPLYAISLLPLFILKNDPRVFYIGNVIFALTGLIVFYLIIKKILYSQSAVLKNKFSTQVLIFFSLFIYVTSYHLYWYPTLAMADNLLLLLFLFGFYVLIHPVSIFKTFLAFIVAGSFFATKFSAFPLTPTYLIIYLFKIISQYKNDKKLLAKLLLLFSIFLFFILQFKKFYLLKLIYQGLYNLFFIRRENSWFSFIYFAKNLSFYFNILVGQPAKVLWDLRPFYPVWVGVGAMVGYILALFKKQSLALSALLLLFSQIIFMSFFYDHDGRYIFIGLPIVFLGFVYFLKFSAILFGKINSKSNILSGNNTFLFFIGLVFLIFSLNNFVRIKSQISLNLRYAERPWYYLSVLEFNNFFITPTTPQKPILISAVAPFLIDFYTNHNYSLLPLSSIQEFRGDKRAKVWGDNDYSDLIGLYKSKINNGFEVFVTNYGLGNNGSKISDFKIINENFTLTQAHSGCHDQCNIYKLEL